MSLRVLHSFPHKIGAGRICGIAWQQVTGVAAAGGHVSVLTGAVARELPADVNVSTTLARGRWRIPYSALGQMRALALHDRVVARRLPKLAGQIDIVHVWPLAARETLRTAARLGIPTVLERPNAHTRFAMEAVAAEGARLGVELPANHEHAYNREKLGKEEDEYELADRLLCPSEFVVKTFEDRGFAPGRLVRHAYGYDESVFRPAEPSRENAGLEALFVGVCAVRKGVHFALEAWLNSPASQTGRFRIAGEFLPAYEERLSEMLAHPSVEVLGHREDIPELMRRSDILLLPSIEEGFGLTCVEAIGSGCVPLVSDACTDACVHDRNALVHAVGDADALGRQITWLDAERGELARLRKGGLQSAPELTWTAAGRKLLAAYEQVVADVRYEGARASAIG